YQRRLAELAGEGAQGLERKSEAFLEGFEERSGQMAQAFLEKSATLKDSADAAANSIRRAAQQAATEFEAAHREMESRFELGGADQQERLTEVAGSGLAGIEIKSQAFLQEFEEKRSQLARTFEDQGQTISGSTGAARVSIREAAEESATEFLLIQQSAERSFEANAGAYHKRLADLAASGAEAL